MAEPLETRLQVVGTEAFVRDLSEAYNAILKVGHASDATARTLREARAPILAMRRAIVGIRTAYRMQHAALIEGMRVMRDVGRIGRTVTSVWQAYNVAMIRTEMAQRKHREATASVIILEEQLKRMQREGISSGSEYTDILLRVAAAKQKVKQASEDEAKAQKDNIIGYIGMGLQLMNLIPQLHWLYYHLRIVRQIRQSGITEIAGEAAARTANIATIGAETVASGTTQTTLATETAVRAATTKGIWAQIAARITSLSLSPWGWAILAGGAITAGAALTWMYTQQAQSQRGMQEGGMVRKEGWYYLHEEEKVTPKQDYAYGFTFGGFTMIPRREIEKMTRGRVTNVTINVYESITPRETADEVMLALRRRGII